MQTVYTINDQFTRNRQNKIGQTLLQTSICILYMPICHTHPASARKPSVKSSFTGQDKVIGN